MVFGVIYLTFSLVIQLYNKLLGHSAFLAEKDFSRFEKALLMMQTPNSKIATTAGDSNPVYLSV